MRKLLYAGLASILLYDCTVIPHKTEGVFPGAIIRKDSAMYTPGTRQIKNAMVVETYVDYERVPIKNYYSDPIYYPLVEEHDKIEVHGKDLFGIIHFLGIPMGRENYGVIIDSISFPEVKPHSITLYRNGKRHYSPDKETLERLMRNKDSVVNANNLARERLRHASDSMKNIMLIRNRGTLYWDGRTKTYVPDSTLHMPSKETYNEEMKNILPKNRNPEYIDPSILRPKKKKQ
jgi:hypothetical protein